MQENRLNGLALLYSSHDVSLNIEEVIDRFAQKNSRRVNFVI